MKTRAILYVVAFLSLSVSASLVAGEKPATSNCAPSYEVLKRFG